MARQRKRAYPPGIRPLDGRPGWWRVRVWTVDTKTGRRREVQRHFEGTEADAVLFRAREQRGEVRPARLTLAEYATTWIDAKADRGRSERTCEDARRRPRPQPDTVRPDKPDTEPDMSASACASTARDTSSEPAPVKYGHRHPARAPAS